MLRSKQPNWPGRVNVTKGLLITSSVIAKERGLKPSLQANLERLKQSPEESTHFSADGEIASSQMRHGVLGTGVP